MFLLFKNELSASFLLKKVVHKCASEDFNEVIIYGAGESCLSVLKFCRISNLKVSFIIDQDVRLHGSFLEGIKISPVKILNKKMSIMPIIIASVSSVNQINFFLSEFSKKEKLSFIIFSINDL